jgi:chaperonin GroES
MAITDQPDDEDEVSGTDETQTGPDGEIVGFEPGDDGDVTDTPDGGAIVKLDDAPGKRDSQFSENLAETLPDPDLKKLSTRLLDLIARDKEARSKRDKQYEEAIKRTGMGNDAPGGAEFAGASKVVHPMLTEACVDFAARAMKELMPAQGPAKDFIPGEVTAPKIAKARRKTALMNWQLTVQSTEFRSELEQLLTQVPLGGAQYLKTTWNSPRNRPSFLFVAIDDMYLPFAATNFYSAQRKTHVQFLTQLDYEERVRNKEFCDVDLAPSGMDPDRSKASEATDKIEGKESTSYNEDGLRTVYEVYTTAALEPGDDDDGDGDDNDEVPKPYIISIDKSTSKVLSIYRNWDEQDDSFEELQWFVEFPFVPWRGAYPIGLSQMIGGLSGAATGALRALLDAAHINNSQTMLKLKGGAGGQSLEIQPTQVLEIEGGLNVDDVRKLAMPLPYNPPSPVLYQLLGFLVDAGKGVVRTTVEDLADSNANAPVGTTLARIEQGMVVFSAIHARLHDAMGRLLRVLHRLNGMYLDDEDIEEEVGEELATRKDFEGPMDVVPVSDPNIFSEAQRYAQVQAIAQRSAAMPGIYDPRKVEERILDVMKVPNAKDLLIPAREPKEQNAVNENVAMTLGKPVVAFPEQDHVAHLQTHLAYYASPILGGNPLITPSFVPSLLSHIREHLALWYASAIFDLGNEEAGQDIGEMMKNNKKPEEKRAFDRMLAQASMLVAGQASTVFAKLPPVIAQAMQAAQALQPPPPMDPTQVASQDVQRKAAADQANSQTKAQELQVKTQELQLDMAKAQGEISTNAQELQMKQQQDQTDQEGQDRRTAAELAGKSAINSDDNQTALTIANLEMVTGTKARVKDGTGINPG